MRKASCGSAKNSNSDQNDATDEMMRKRLDIFGQWQAEYAGRGLATFPVQIVGKDKIPMTRGYHRTGLRGSTELTRRFGSAKALGITLNQYRMIVDLDTTNESILAEVLAEHGDTPLIARTASKGGFHCYYGTNEGAWRHYSRSRRVIHLERRYVCFGAEQCFNYTVIPDPERCDACGCSRRWASHIG
jgi:hypothetical protein